MEILDPIPPDQEWENGAFWLSFCLILDFCGGWRFAVPFHSVQDYRLGQNS